MRHTLCATMRGEGTVPGEEKMLTLEDVKNAVRDSNELWKAGREREALELLNHRIVTARQDNSARPPQNRQSTPQEKREPCWPHFDVAHPLKLVEQMHASKACT